MDIWLKISIVLFHFIIEREVTIEPRLKEYLVNPSSNTPHVCIRVVWNWDSAKHIFKDKDGEDSIQEYYIENDLDYCLTKGGVKGPIACVCCSKDYKNLKCYINEEPFIYSPNSLGHILRFLPIRAIFQRNGVLFFHGSMISVRNRGIVFLGPSGIGKTTQSKLWEKYEGATRLCNDRVLISNNNKWLAYSFPNDGSDPIDGNNKEKLKVVVILNRAEDNNIRYLRPAEAICKMMPQVVMDSWSNYSREKATEQLIELVQDIPVLEFYATADKEAVKYLDNALKEGGIL